MVSVKLDHVTKRFGEVTAVNDVSFTIPDKELAVIVGPSGCGKTTVLRLIAGLEKPDSGYIYFGKVCVNDVAIRDRGIAMVFQDYALYPHMSVYDNMAFGLRNLGYKKEEVDKRVKNAAKLLDITHLLERKPSQLSGGQKQRVALGRAIVREPKIFLWDEPLSNLDAKMRVIMRAELRKLQKELKITTIHVTHDQLEAMTMADRVIVMRAGRVEQVGTPEEIYDFPANTFVAGFIGTPPINFFRASVVMKKSKVILDAGEFSIELPSEIAKIIRKADCREVIAGVRPEDILISRKGEKNTIEMKVDLVEPIGSEDFLYMSRGNLRMVAKAPPKIGLKMGDKITITFNMKHIHIFDAKTEKAVV